MGTSKKLRFLIYGSTMLLIILLPVLAWLQYTWLGQLSEAEKVRMKSNLEISAQRMSEDFDKTMTSLYHSFSHQRENSPQSLSQAWKNWQYNSAYPSLIESVYILQHPGKKISILDTNKLELSITNWPDWLKPYDQYFVDSGPEAYLKIISLTHGPVLDSTAFILASPGEIISAEMFPNHQYVLIKMRLSVLKENLISDLVKQYFTYDEELPYLVSIMKEDDIFYTSEDQISRSAMADPDATASIGRWSAQNFLFTSTDIEVKPHDGGKKKIEKEMSLNRLSVKIVREDTTRDSNFTRYFIARVPGWELRVKHKLGSLEAVIKSNRIINFLISSGILLILIVAVLLTLLSAKKLEALARRQMEFVAGVTHELRTPLAVIRSAGENIADGLVKEPSQLQKYGEVIRDEGRRLSESIEQALQFAGINARAKNYKSETIILNGFFDDLIQSLHANGREIKIEQDDPGLQIRSDRLALQTVFTNLLQNAIKFSHDAGLIVIKIQKNEESVIITVSDKGMGIPAGDIKHVFEPFYRAENASNQQIEGYGLGLAVVKSILISLGAHIRVESDPLTGTSFTVSFSQIGENDDH